MSRRDEDLAGQAILDEALPKCSQVWVTRLPLAEKSRRFVCESTEVVYTDERDSSFCRPCLSELYDDDELDDLLA